PPLVTLTTLSVIDVVTVTLRDDDAEVMPGCVTPSDHCTVHGAVPVSVNGTLTVDARQEAAIVAGSVIVGPDVMATVVDPFALQPSAETVMPRRTLPLGPAV